jgi:hypothetical protein
VRIVNPFAPGGATDVMVHGPRTLAAKVGERVPLAYDLAAVHLFDPQTRHRL